MRVFPVTSTRVLFDVITHPSIWRDSVEDGTEMPVRHEEFAYLLAQGTPVGFAPEDLLAGFVYYRHLSRSRLEAHTSVLPEFRGAIAEAGVRATLRWVFAHTRAIKVVTHVPFDLPHVRRFAKRVGLQDEGVDRQSFRRGGRVLDQWNLGITRTEACH